MAVSTSHCSDNNTWIISSLDSLQQRSKETDYGFPKAQEEGTMLQIGNIVEKHAMALVLKEDFLHLTGYLRIIDEHV